MTAMRSVLWVVFVSALSLVAFSSGCGEEEVALRETLSLEDYLRAIEAARDRADERVTEDPSDGNLASEEGQAYWREVLDIMRNFEAEISALEPPAEAVMAHDRLLESMVGSLLFLENSLEQASLAKSEEEQLQLQEAFFDDPELVDAEDRFLSACHELQRMADAEAIAVNLNCDGTQTNEVEIIDDQATPLDPECGWFCYSEQHSFCEILPGIETSATPPPDFEPPFNCPDGSREFDFGSIKGRISEPPPLPPNLIAASDYIEFEFDGEEPAVAGFVLPLKEQFADPSTIAFYTYDEGEWRRFAEVVFILNDRAEGGFDSRPRNIAVLREAR